jgi:hypothetical protein
MIKTGNIIGCEIFNREITGASLVEVMKELEDLSKHNTVSEVIWNSPFLNELNWFEMGFEIGFQDTSTGSWLPTVQATGKISAGGSFVTPKIGTSSSLANNIGIVGANLAGNISINNTPIISARNEIGWYYCYYEWK